LTNRTRHEKTFNQMVEGLHSGRLDRTFRALSDATRRALLDQLSQGERTVGELARPFEMSLAAVAKHLNVLDEAGLIQRRYEGRQCWCSLDLDGLRTVDGWLSFHRRFWEERLDALEATIVAERRKRKER
jgi:DNA-binding transcriptional ArsR family regulator